LPTYRELLQAAKAAVEEVNPTRARELLDADDAPLLVDVREREEWEQGRIPGAVHVPRGNLESRIETVAPDRSRPVLLYCAAGNRSAFAARTLTELGYDHAISLAGGYTDWQRNGFPTDLPPLARARADDALQPPPADPRGRRGGPAAAARLADPADRRGRPRLTAALYLAAAGIGKLGIVDADVVDETNLQRQIGHSTNSLGEPKTDSARRTIEALNPDVEVVPFRERPDLREHRADPRAGWDVIVDGADNFPTRYLVNDASVWHDIPVVHGSIFRFEGQVTVFKPGDGPCYRCLFPQPPPPELAPSCAEGGVLGVLPGVIGSIQATEALKLALGIGDPLVGRLLLYDALSGEFQEMKLRKNPECPGLRRVADDHEYVDYVEFCAGSGTEPRAASRPTLRGRDRGRARGRGARRHGPRAARRPARAVSPPCAGSCSRTTSSRRSSTSTSRARTSRTRRPRDGRRRRLDRDPASGNGRWLGAGRARLLDLVGNTPLVELPRLSPRPRSGSYAKARGPEPDRVDQGPRGARDGRGRRGSSRAEDLLEPTSGNTGISLAARRQAEGLPAHVRDARERDRGAPALLRLYGAEIVESPGEEGSNGAVRVAQELAERGAALPDALPVRERGEPARTLRGTGGEIVAALDRLDVLVAGLGTGGTLMGAGRRVRESFPDVTVAPPSRCLGDPVMGLRSLEDGYVPPILDVAQLDRKLLVSNAEAVAGLRALLEQEGGLRRRLLRRSDPRGPQAGRRARRGRGRGCAR
jgi:molybdopterin/thiamine biosynthesis adenylyltransferase/cysteine synthase/rhodanese-related sulfurtransferase